MSLVAWVKRRGPPASAEATGNTYGQTKKKGGNSALFYSANANRDQSTIRFCPGWIMLSRSLFICFNASTDMPWRRAMSYRLSPCRTW